MELLAEARPGILRGALAFRRRLGSLLSIIAIPFFTTVAFAQSPPLEPGSTVAVAAVTAPGPEASNAPATDTAGASGQAAPAAAPQTSNERYRDGIVIWETEADARVPFLL